MAITLHLSLPIIITVIILTVLSILDIRTYKLKDGYIPAFLSTAGIIIALILTGTQGLYGGVLGLVIGLVLVDLNMFDGGADLKTIIIASIILQTSINIIIFATILSLIALSYKLIIKYYFKKETTIPFIPLITISYIITTILSQLIF